MLHELQAATDPWAPGVSYHRFMMDRVTRMSTAWLTALRRGEPITVNGRNITLEWERANQKLREKLERTNMPARPGAASLPLESVSDAD